MKTRLALTTAPRKRKALAVLFGLFSCCFGWILRDAGGRIELHLEERVAQAQTAQLFYDRGEGYSERESITLPLVPGENHVSITLPRGPISRLRFDPVASPAAAVITAIAVRRGPAVPWEPLSLDSWLPAGATRIERNEAGAILLVAGVTSDPQIEFAPPVPLNAAAYPIDLLDCVALIAVLALIAAIFSYACVTSPIGVARHLVPFGMALAAGLILALALISATDRSVHPDEFSHLAAYTYFKDRWLPPAVGDPATVPSLSIWGYSYLFEMDVVYDIAAHLTAPLQLLTQNALLSARLFQFALWVGLCALALCRRGWFWPLSVTLLSPQVWYIFAYFNADALPFFLALIAAAAVAEKDNGLHAFVRRGTIRGPMLWIAAVCIGLLVVSKRNYLPVVPVLLLWLAAMHLQLSARIVFVLLSGIVAMQLAIFLGGLPAAANTRLPLALSGLSASLFAAAITIRRCWKDLDQRMVLLRLAAFAVLCVAIALPRVLWDVQMNGTPAEKTARIHAVEEDRAGADFKPSRIASGNGEPTLALAARGVPLRNVILAPHHWAYLSAISAFGGYGYFNVFAPPWLYVALLLCALAVVVAGASALRTHDRERWRTLLTIAAGAWVLIALDSLLLSWIDQLQPQGRYLLPMLPVLALMLGSGARSDRRSSAVTVISTAVAFVLASVSFAFVGLPAFAR